MAVVVSAIGSGMTSPLLVIYLHNERHYSLALAGAAVAIGPLISLAGNPLGGYLTDRLGPSWPLAGGYIISAFACIGLVSPAYVWQPITACALVGFGVSIAWPAETALLAQISGGGQHATLYSLRNIALNVGLALGGLTGSIATGNYEILFVADSISFLGAGAILARSGRRSRPGAVPAKTAPGSASGGYRRVLADTTFLRLLVVTCVLSAVAFGQLRIILPAYASDLGLDPRYVSLAYVLNTVLVVLGQLPIARLFARRRRTDALRALCVTFIVTWTVFWSSSHQAGWVQVVTFVSAAGLFAVGELFIAIGIQPLGAGLAVAGLEGRYSGALTVAFTAGFTLGPLLTGFTLSLGSSTVLFATLIVGCAVSLLFVRRLRVLVRPAVDDPEHERESHV
ncbi:MFS transporter [Kribbella ginsengisoli]